jgi:ABC-type dipeptide/oligopeptide/nickel transport system ATPase component
MPALLELRISARYGQQTVLSDLRLTIEPGEILGLVGQSGSGKSTLGLAILGLLDRRGGQVSGEMLFDGRDLLRMKDTEMRRIRGREIALVLQSASAALNPSLRVEDHFAEAWRAHSSEPWRRKRVDAIATLAELDLPASDEFLRRYPHQISVGQAQRVLIALALLHRPRLIVADELTSALDLVTTHEVLHALRRASQIANTAVLFISHDLGAVSALCHRVAILRNGTIVETAPVEQLFAHPQQDYTRQLIALHRATASSVSSDRSPV